jgi:para-nitrobenzyl esterase
MVPVRLPMRHRATLSIVLGVALLTAFPSDLHPQEPVRIRSGLVRGIRDGDLVTYKGIPYAAPPLADLRWKPPQPARWWDGVREATTFSLPCAQSPFPPGTHPGPWTEDCLTINIWAPPVRPDSLLPVLVVIPGGGFFTGGGGGELLNDGSNLAKHGIVVVSFNYRLGVFGFFAHPVLSKESATHVSGNYGPMDQLLPALALGVASRIGAQTVAPAAAYSFVTCTGASRASMRVVASEARPFD